MKRRICWLLLICLLLGSIPLTASAAIGGSCGKNVSWSLDSSGTLTVSGSGPMAEYTHYTQVPWDSQRTAIQKVVIGKGVTTVAPYSFRLCGNLTQVSMASTVTSIGMSAFESCDSLTRLTLGSNVKTVGVSAFYDCTALEAITVPSSVTSIGFGAFFNCRSLHHVYITDLANWCAISFAGANSNPLSNGADLYVKEQPVTQAVFPSGIQKIASYAFYGWKGVREITFPASLTELGQYAFAECSDLARLTFTGQPVTFGKNALQGVTATAYYPDDPKWEQAEKPNGGGTVTWKSDSPEGEPVNPFVDVPSDRFEKAILWAYYNGITTGTGDGTAFSPENTCTRKQIVTFLWRAAGEPEPRSMENPFKDVKSDRFEKAILWAYYEGITTGTGDGTTFSPENTCTRKQIVTFLWRYHDQPAPKSNINPFTDVPSDRFKDAILWAYGEGITTGTGDGTTFSPENPCTRKQIVTFLYRDLAQ